VQVRRPHIRSSEYFGTLVKGGVRARSLTLPPKPFARIRTLLAPAQPEDNSGLLAGHGGSATGGGILYQQKLAAWICSWILSEQLVDQQFGLGWATAEWIRCETEAPVDDVLVKTREGGYIAIQAKVTLNLSASLDSGFGKTVDQFVRHWIVCKGIEPS
jgi:hypothetical protein